MANLKHPANLKYSKTDEWVRVEAYQATIGITDYAQDQLGDIVYVELPWDVATRVTHETKFGDIESVKATSEHISRVTCVVVQVNEALKVKPERTYDNKYECEW